ncbi:MAG: hypothetical protein U0T83_07745 [Bacteriovoracaceae bacterium]
MEKLANICEEMNDLDKVQEGLLKKFIAEDFLSAERKYKDFLIFTQQQD